MKQWLVLLSSLALITIFGLTVRINSQLASFSSPGLIQAQADPIPVAGSEVCQNIGNNLAVQYENPGVSAIAGEPKYTLAILNTARDIQPIIDAINNNPETKFIIRVGASTNSLGPNAIAYAEMIQQIRIATTDFFGGASGSEIIVMVSHNEANGQESDQICLENGGPTNVCEASIFEQPDLFRQKQDIVLEAEVNFARRVVANTQGLENITYITGQLDNYFNSDTSADNSRSSDFAARLLQVVPEISGVALPLYTTPNFSSGLQAYSLLDDTINKINTSAGRQADIYITESGPFADYSVGFESEFDVYAENVAQAMQHPQVKSLLLFNAGGFNTDELFRYTEPFWNEDCRRVLRESCLNIEEVVSVCGSGAGDHSCKNFCKGNPYEPCALTPKKDCSIPFDPEDLINPNASEEKIDLMADYILNYLSFAEPAIGLHFQFKGFLQNGTLCDPANAEFPLYETLCRGAFTENASTGLELDSIKHTIYPVGENIGDVSFLNNRGVFDAPTGVGFDAGPNQRITTNKQWWTRIGRLQELKEECYIRGRVTETITDPKYTEIFGPVRCVNYVELAKTYTYGIDQIRTERDLFFGQSADNPGPLISCIGDPGGQSCINAFNSLPDELRNEVQQLSIIPVATFPIIGLVEEIPSAREPGGSSFGDMFSKIQSKIEDFKILFLNKSRNTYPNSPDRPENPEEETGRLFTSYYVKTITGGQDAHIAAQQVTGQLTPQSIIDQNNLRLDDLVSEMEINRFDLIRGAREFSDPNVPFNKTHIPEGSETDLRFVLINRFMNINSNYEICSSNIQNADRSLKQEEDNIPVGGPSEYKVDYTTEEADLTNLVTSVGLGHAEDEGGLELQSYLACEIYPRGLGEADKNAEVVGSSLLPQKLWNDVFKEQTDSKTDFPTKITTNGSIRTSGRDCRHYPTEGDESPPACCTVGYCDPGSGAPGSLIPDLPACPANCGVEAVTMELRAGCLNRDPKDPATLFGGCEVIDDGKEIEASIHTKGGKPNYLVSKLLKSGVATSVKSIFSSSKLEVNDDGQYTTKPNDEKYFCFLKRIQGKICDPDVDEYENDTASNKINCENVPDSQVPSEYLGSFKTKYIDICNRWSGAGKSNVEVCYNDVVKRANQAGINPTFALSIWANESACSNYTRSSLAVQDFGINNTSLAAAEDFEAQITAFLNEAATGIATKKASSQFGSCFDTSRWSDFEAYMFIYKYGRTYTNFGVPDLIEQYGELEEADCTEFDSSIDYPNYYDDIRTGAWSFITTCPFLGSPTDNSCRP